MTILEVLALLLIAAVCGAIGQSLAGRARGGLLAAIVLGFIGALLGSWLARSMGLPELFVISFDSIQFPLVWSVIGASLFVAVLTLIARPAPRTA